MDNQHKKITGYRDLNDGEIHMINDIKKYGELLNGLIERLGRYDETDQRWMSIGKTHLQQGIMALVRSVAKPGGF